LGDHIEQDAMKWHVERMDEKCTQTIKSENLYAADLELQTSVSQPL